MKILLLIIQKLLDDYYIFGYYISGWDHPTENAITENVIKVLQCLNNRKYDFHFSSMF